MRISFLLTLLLVTLTAFAGDKVTEVFTLDHQMSQHCEKRIKESLRFEKGISKIDVSLKDNTITITYDKSKTDTEKIIEGFKKIGFTAFPYCGEPTVCPEEDSSQPAYQGCCGEGCE